MREVELNEVSRVASAFLLLKLGVKSNVEIGYNGFLKR